MQVRSQRAGNVLIKEYPPKAIWDELTGI